MVEADFQFQGLKLWVLGFEYPYLVTDLELSTPNCQVKLEQVTCLTLHELDSFLKRVTTALADKRSERWEESLDPFELELNFAVERTEHEYQIHLKVDVHNFSIQERHQVVWSLDEQGLRRFIRSLESLTDIWGQKLKEQPL